MSWRANSPVISLKSGPVLLLLFLFFSIVLRMSCTTRMDLPKDLGDSDFTGNVPCIENYFRKVQNTLLQKKKNPSKSFYHRMARSMIPLLILQPLQGVLKRLFSILSRHLFLDNILRHKNKY